MSRGMSGERGMTGDHGQDGKPGPTGQTGARGLPGKDVLTKGQTLALFAFVVFAFVLLAWRSETNAGNIQQNNERITQFVDEVCNRSPEMAPRTCERKVDE